MYLDHCLGTGVEGLLILTSNALEEPGNQLVSYTRQMNLVRRGHQAKFENASFRTKHFRISL